VPTLLLTAAGSPAPLPCRSISSADEHMAGYPGTLIRAPRDSRSCWRPGLCSGIGAFLPVLFLVRFVQTRTLTPFAGSTGIVAGLACLAYLALRRSQAPLRPSSSRTRYPWLVIALVFLLPTPQASAFIGFEFPGDVAAILGGVADSAGYLTGRRGLEGLLHGFSSRFPVIRRLDKHRESARAYRRTVRDANRMADIRDFASTSPMRGSLLR
jgi:hypothetical protein